MEDYLKSLPLWIYVIPYLLHIIVTYQFTNTDFIKEYNKSNLYDLIASNTLNLNKYCEVINYSIILLLIPFILNYKKDYLISIFKYLSIIIFFRSILSYVTVLPSCKDEKDNYGKFKKYFLGHSNDKIFSGHISLCIVLIYLLYRNKIIDSYTLCLFLIILLFNSVLIILCRWHYTVDVLLAYIITPFIILLSPNL